MTNSRHNKHKLVMSRVCRVYCLPIKGLPCLVLDKSMHIEKIQSLISNKVFRKASFGLKTSPFTSVRLNVDSKHDERV